MRENKIQGQEAVSDKVIFSDIKIEIDAVFCKKHLHDKN